MATRADDHSPNFYEISGRPVVTVGDLAANNWQTEVSNIEAINYWPDFGTLQYVELAYVLFIIVLGSLGNLVVVFSIVLEEKVHSSGNVFIISLAVADFLVCSITFPSIAANIVATDNTLNKSKLFCDIMAYIVTATGACSLYNLALIAINRYWAVVRYASYKKYFRKNVCVALAILSWVWSILLVSPTVLGWGALTFDAKALVCGWLDTASLSYSIFLIILAVILPLGVIAFSYARIFCVIRASVKWKQGLRAQSRTAGYEHRRPSRRDRNLIRTLIATVVAYCVCWTPYAVHVLVDPGHTSAQLKKFLVWLALSNSSVNFIIYGTLNSAFKKRYKKLFFFIFKCEKADKAVGGSRNAWSSGNSGQKLAVMNRAGHVQRCPSGFTTGRDASEFARQTMKIITPGTTPYVQ